MQVSISGQIECAQTAPVTEELSRDKQKSQHDLGTFKQFVEEFPPAMTMPSIRRVDFRDAELVQQVVAHSEELFFAFDAAAPEDNHE
jgi:hypothetical protein